MYNENFQYELGAYDVVNLLYELHQRGYQQLRLFSMMAPNGCAMRTCITTKRNMMPYGINIESWDDDKVWPHSSSMNILYKGDYDKLADDFIRAFPNLCRNGFGSDPGYTMWLRNLMPLMHDGWYPEMDYISNDEVDGRYFKHGEKRIPFPPL